MKSKEIVTITIIVTIDGARVGTESSGEIFWTIHQTKDHAGYIKRSQKNIENDDEHQNSK